MIKLDRIPTPTGPCMARTPANATARRLQAAAGAVYRIPIATSKATKETPQPAQVRSVQQRQLLLWHDLPTQPSTLAQHNRFEVLSFDLSHKDKNYHRPSMEQYHTTF